MMKPSAAQIERAKRLLASEGASAGGGAESAAAAGRVYDKLDGELRRAMAVVKLRASQHSKELREYDITSDGAIVVGRPLKGYEGRLTGTPSTDGKRRKRQR